MKDATFSRLVVLGFAVSLMGDGIFYFGVMVLPADIVAKVMVILLGLSYLLGYHLTTGKKTGLMVVPTLMLLLSLVLWFLSPPFMVYLALFVGAIWLLRSVLSYQSIICSLIDLSLTTASLALAIAVFNYNYSIFLSIWTFFLLQSLTAFIPKSINSNSSKAEELGSQQHFYESQRQAEQALRKISSLRS